MRFLLGSEVSAKQRPSLELGPSTMHKAGILAAKRGLSVGALVATLVEEASAAEDRYEAAQRDALEWLRRGFHLGGTRLHRGTLHER